MRINSVYIDTTGAKEFGLKETTLNRLNKIVLLAGKNGSGKTRMINYIRSYLHFKLTHPDSKSLENDIIGYESNIKVWQESINRNKISNSLNPDQLRENESLKANIERTLLALKETKEKLYHSNKISIKGKGHYLDYVPKTINLTDANDLAPNKLKDIANSVSDNGLHKLPVGSIAAIQYLQNQWFNVTHPKSSLDNIEKENIIQRYEKLNQYINKFLNTNLDRDANGSATIFGKPIGLANLSDGQKIFIQFCVALHAQEGNLADYILFLDEPENHLHPAALIEVLEKLNEVVTNGQIWIATHSINVLAHFSDATTYYIEDGQISYAGNGPEKVLQGLLGDEEEIEKLSSFLDLPFALSSAKFSHESLLDAPVVMTGSDDPQIKQIKEALEELKSADKKLSILDYGAGKGRLIATIAEKETDLINWLDYVAFDLYDTNSEECKKNIAAAYGSVDRRYYNLNKNLRTDRGDKSFDLIILTNVFHEIPPDEWLNVVKEIKSLLKETGYLLIVEDQRLPHGEKPNAYGFHVLDTFEFRKLFNFNKEEEGSGKLYNFNEKQGYRLKAHFFREELLGRVTSETRKAALKELFENASKEVETIRTSGNKDFKTGKLHAFWITQLANAQLVLNKLG
jgi:SAM-dependent methyltransferase/ABC-type lipoprotein export system ATPase subunit